MIRFLLNDELIELNSPQPDLTVLDWLRVHQQMIGTKEGCGSGDCGACTAVLVSASDTASGLPLSYVPANTCILMIGALHGKQLITVEHIGSATQLHPVQSAMVEHHGSQCGFCTPGFVMSLFTLFHQNLEANGLLNEPSQRHALIEQYLGGNLCRCTGYRPIIAAADAMLEARFKHKVSDEFDANATTTAEALLSIQAKPSRLNKTDAPETSVHVPTSLQEGLSLWERYPDAQLIAGGTDLGLEITQQLKSWSAVIHLNDVAELNHVQHNADELVVGAGVSVAQLLETLTLDYPDAIPMLLRFGSEQVRSQATVGGNLGTASPIGDLPPLLIALGAQIDLVSLAAGGAAVQSRTVPLSNYFVDYRKTLRTDDEWISAVRIPLPNANDVLRVYKISKRLDDDISAVCAAIWMRTNPQGDELQIEDVRLGFGGMAAIPKRAHQTEEVMRGRTLSAQTVDAACEKLSDDFQPISDARASASYRNTVARNLLQRFLIELTDSGQPTSITAIELGAVT